MTLRNLRDDGLSIITEKHIILAYLIPTGLAIFTHLDAYFLSL